MKRKLTLTFNGGSHGLLKDTPFIFDGGKTLTIEGDFAFTVENQGRFVDVKLLDATGISRNQADMTWTYEDTLDHPLQKGEYVMVPFGWANRNYLAKVVTTSDEPSYTGFAPIKKVAARMVKDA